MSAEIDSNPSRHDIEAAAAKGRVIDDPKSISFLFGLSKETFIPKEVIESRVENYEDLMAVLNIVQAGWGRAESDGVRITDTGKRISSLMFEQASDQTRQTAQ